MQVVAMADDDVKRKFMAIHQVKSEADNGNVSIDIENQEGSTEKKEKSGSGEGLDNKKRKEGQWEVHKFLTKLVRLKKKS